MKKLLSLILTLIMVSFLFAGCTNVLEESKNTTTNEVASKPAKGIVDYSSMDYKAGEIMVKVTKKDVLEKILDKNNIDLIKEWEKINWYLIEVPSTETTISFLRKLNANKDIILAEPNMNYELDEVVVPEIEDYDLQWGFQNLNAESAWGITTGSEDVVVAIVDTGVDVDHPEFATEKFDGQNALNVPYGKFGLENMYDLNGHGTHVAGIAADDGRTGKIAGVAWDSKILPIMVMNDSGAIYTSYLTTAMLYLGNYADYYSERSVVANMSIGGRGYSFAFKDAIDHAAENGVLLVTSAGNDTKRVLSYPSAYNGVVSVAASTPTDKKADFSTIGHWNSVAAPGVKILSTYPDEISSGYSYLQGTSMASPYVCGAAALLLAEHPDLDPLEVKNQLEQTASGNGFTEELGYGVVDLENMLGELQPMQYGSLDVETNIISTKATGFIGTGVITVFDSNGILVSHGTTEEDGSHTFWALKPGDYTVSVSYYDMFKDDYVVKTENVIITADDRVSLTMTTEVPQDVTRTEYDSVLVEEKPQLVYQLKVNEKNTFEFETMSHPDYGPVDTVMELQDEDGNILAMNDDFGGSRYSYLAKTLNPGNYYVIAYQWNESPSVREEFSAKLVINELDVIY